MATSRASQLPDGCSYEYAGVRFYLPPQYSSFCPLGRGSFGTVISADDSARGRRVAIKKISCAGADVLSVKRVLRELNLLQALDHPHVLAVLDVLRGGDEETHERTATAIAGADQHEATTAPSEIDGEGGDDGGRTSPRRGSSVAPVDAPITSLYIVTEALVGDLAHLISNPAHSFSEAQVAKITYQLLSAVTYLHAHDIIHRDLKPGNILVDADYNIKICDFGLARMDPNAFADPCDAPDTTLAVSDDAPLPPQAQVQAQPPPQSQTRPRRPMTAGVMSRWYRAPEVYLSSPGRYGREVDLWGCGCCLGEMIGRAVLFPSHSAGGGGGGAGGGGSAAAAQVRLIFDLLGRPGSEEVDSFPELRPDARQMLHALMHSSAPSSAAAPPGSGGLNGSSSGNNNAHRPGLYDPGSNLPLLFPFAPLPALDLLWRLLRFHPARRPPAHVALQHPYLAANFRVADLPPPMKREWRVREQSGTGGTPPGSEVAQGHAQPAAAGTMGTATTTIAARRDAAAAEQLQHYLSATATQREARHDPKHNRRSSSDARSCARSRATNPCALPSPIPGPIPGAVAAAATAAAGQDPSPLGVVVAPAVVLAHSGLRCDCGFAYCSFCQTSHRLAERMLPFERACARMEAAQAEGKRPGTAAPATPAPVPEGVDSAGFGQDTLQALLRQQVEEFVRPTTAGMIRRAVDTLALTARSQSLARTMLPAPASVVTAEQASVAAPVSPHKQPLVGVSPSSPPEQTSPPESAAVTPLPLPLSLPGASASPVSASTSRPPLLRASSRPNAVLTFAAASKRFSNPPAAFDPSSPSLLRRAHAVAVGVGGMSPTRRAQPQQQSQFQHHRSISMPIWTDMVASVAANGMATSAVPPCEGDSAGGSGSGGGKKTPLPKSPLAQATVREEACEDGFVPATTAVAPPQQQPSLRRASSLALVGSSLNEVPLSPGSIAGSVDGLLAAMALQQKQLQQQQQQQRSQDSDAVAGGGRDKSLFSPKRASTNTSLPPSRPAPIAAVAPRSRARATLPSMPLVRTSSLGSAVAGHAGAQMSPTPLSPQTAPLGGTGTSTFSAHLGGGGGGGGGGTPRHATPPLSPSGGLSLASPSALPRAGRASPPVPMPMLPLTAVPAAAAGLLSSSSGRSLLPLSGSRRAGVNPNRMSMPSGSSIAVGASPSAASASKADGGPPSHRASRRSNPCSTAASAAGAASSGTSLTPPLAHTSPPSHGASSPSHGTPGSLDPALALQMNPRQSQRRATFRLDATPPSAALPTPTMGAHPAIASESTAAAQASVVRARDSSLNRSGIRTEQRGTAPASSAAAAACMAPHACHTDGSLPAPRGHHSSASRAAAAASAATAASVPVTAAPSAADPVFGALVHPNASAEVPNASGFAPFPRRRSSTHAHSHQLSALSLHGALQRERSDSDSVAALTNGGAVGRGSCDGFRPGHHRRKSQPLLPKPPHVSSHSASPRAALGLTSFLAATGSAVPTHTRRVTSFVSSAAHARQQQQQQQRLGLGAAFY